jgi:glycosyltransferase involved in cell wall biosynthesis
MAPEMDGLSAAVVSKLLRKADRVVAVSRAQQKSFDFAEIPDRHFVVIPNGVEPGIAIDATQRRQARERLGIPDSDGVIVAIGRLAPEKGIDLLISAFSAILNALPNALLILVGSGQSAKSLQLFASVKAPNRIRFEGHIPNPLIYYAAADIVAVPSRSEGQGITALEAMSHGLPVVASNTGGLAESITDGVTGRLFPEGNAHVLTRTLTELLREPAERERLGKAARERVLKTYSTDASIQQIAKLYHEILDNRK